MPSLFGHGTTVAAGLKMSVDGAVKAGDTGKIGRGCYCFAVDSDDPTNPKQTIEKVWMRGGSGGYNCGCVVIVKSRGILVNRVPENIMVPPGCTANHGDQYCLHPGVVEWVSITFDMQALIHVLREHLDALGYTAKLHAAISKMQKYLADNVVIDKKALERAKPSGKQADASSSSQCRGALPAETITDDSWTYWQGMYWTTFDNISGWWTFVNDDNCSGWYVLRSAAEDAALQGRRSDTHAA